MEVNFKTHKVVNQVPPLVRKNTLNDDPIVYEKLNRSVPKAFKSVEDYGRLYPTLEALGFEANHNLPQCHTHDRYGHQLDTVEYHPAYHALMTHAMKAGLHSLPWVQKESAHLTRMAMFYLHAQAEAGTACPLSMTYAGAPLLDENPKYKAWANKVRQFDYDPNNQPIDQKKSITLGMAMTEKQGGSDVRANLTQAYLEGDSYALTGHKWFCSAPMSDGFFVTAMTHEGLSCFLVPRWQDNGTKNAMHLVRLKNKCGNQSNASSEVEFLGAQGFLMGELGRGIQTIIQMVALTRFDCMTGSTALMRCAWVQACHHAKHRQAFGRLLIEQPLMQNVLAHTALEIEAHLRLCFHMADLLDQKGDNVAPQIRLLTAIGKYWICKRAPMIVAELLECLGGAGYVEDFILARLYREAPLNAIWEGCGNIQCLDVLRTLKKEPHSFEVLCEKLEQPAKQNHQLIESINHLKNAYQKLDEFKARQFVEILAQTVEAALMVEQAPEFVHVPFMDQIQKPHKLLGTLDHIQAKKIIERFYIPS